MSYRKAAQEVGRVLSRRIFVASLWAALGFAAVFAFWPELDLAVAALFYAGDGHFIGRGRWGDFWRAVGYLVPFLVLALFLIAFAARRFGMRIWASPSVPSLLLLVLSMVLGPGLLANLVLKDHSHRPRPVQVREFGGGMEFRPWYRFDGACPRNCAFISGEATEAFWMLAPASLAPAPLQPVAIAGAMVFALAVGGLRMAFGGHFLTDVIFAGFFMTWLVFAIRYLTHGPPAGHRGD
jgi:lipid A 4'-phosphatase